MATTATPHEVLDAVRGAREALSVVHSPGAARGSREEWAEALGALQALVNEATAVQDCAVVALAAVEPEWCEDGTIGEVHRAPGHLALDAPAIVSGVLCLSAVAAERRVRDAVRRAADGPEGTDSCTGVGGLHAAMAAGRLDAYRAQVVAHELEECPAEVAATVITSLDEHFTREDAARLRRRARRLLARISPDLLRRRAERARSESSLRRWVDEPGVDTWLGTFPSEDARTAWAAIDALAQQYVSEGACATIDRARAKALTDLVTSNATIDVQIVLTTAAGSSDPAPSMPDGVSTDLVDIGTDGVGIPVLVERGWLDRAVAATTVTGRDLLGRPRLLTCDAGTGAPVDLNDELTVSAYRPSAKLAAFVRARDRHCRFPGCTIAARYCDLDHVTPWPAGPTSAANLVCLCRRHHRVKQRPGWRTALDPDGTYTVTDPTGRTRTTDPPDQRPAPLLWEPGELAPPPASNPSLVLPDGPHSTLEFTLEHHLGPPTRRPGCRVDWRRPTRPVHVTTDHPPRTPRRSPLPDTPPF